MKKPKMAEFEAETRAENAAYQHMIGWLTADATNNADKKGREYARQLLKRAAQWQEEKMDKLREGYNIEK